MPNPVIKVIDLGKRYDIGSRQSSNKLSEKITEALTNPLAPVARMFSKKNVDLWALKNINFEIGEGEVVGVIGRNGSGKSTLLKILSSVTEPTNGKAELLGKSSSLLEVGTGFHPELTGRENIYLNGTILGMTRREIDRKYDQIVEFSEIGKFLDTPIKRYSSGMSVRLAFAVAVHLDPDILMVDEVLGVGDLRFQKKCYTKMNEVVKNGKTILFVTHQMNAIRRLCTKCIWLEDGAIKMFGPTPSVTAAYETASLTRSPDTHPDNSNEYSQFLSWSIESTTSHEAHQLADSGPFTLVLTVKISKTLSDAQTGIALWSSGDELMWATSQSFSLKPGVHQLRFTLPGLPLRPGSYRWHSSLWSEGKLLDEWFAVPELVIATEPVGHPSDNWAGILNLPNEFQIKSV